MAFRPLHDRVLVERLEIEEKTAGAACNPYYQRLVIPVNFHQRNALYFALSRAKVKGVLQNPERRTLSMSNDELLSRLQGIQCLLRLIVIQNERASSFADSFQAEIMRDLQNRPERADYFKTVFNPPDILAEAAKFIELRNTGSQAMQERQ